MMMELTSCYPRIGVGYICNEQLPVLGSSLFSKTNLNAKPTRESSAYQTIKQGLEATGSVIHIFSVVDSPCWKQV